MTVVGRPPLAGSRGRGRSASRLAWLLYVLALALVGLAAGLWLVVHRPVAGAVGYGYWREGMVNGLAFATVGVVITSRRPEHPVGWLFLGAGLVGAAQLATGSSQRHSWPPPARQLAWPWPPGPPPKSSWWSLAC